MADIPSAGASGSVGSWGVSGRHWSAVAGAWLGIGTSPGTLLLGAGIAARYGGPIPILSLGASMAAMYLVLWYSGKLGLLPPHGQGGDLSQVASYYMEPLMQRLLGGLIAAGMIGWFGFNVGLGGAALAALLGVSTWAAVLILGIPVLILSFNGIRAWNGLALLTALSVFVLVGIVLFRLSGGNRPVTLASPVPVHMLADVAIFIGYISVFSTRAPDFTAGLETRKDLVVSVLLLTVPVIGIAAAGASLQQGTGSADLVQVLANQEGLAAGNLLITLAVIAPTFTTFHSGVPGLRSAFGFQVRPAMAVIAVIGMFLAMLRFDLLLLSWLKVLAAMLPPVIVPLVVEAALRRRGYAPRQIPLWLWLVGAAITTALTLAGIPSALLFGLLATFTATLVWRFSPVRR